MLNQSDKDAVLAKNWTPKITQMLTLLQTNTATLTPFTSLKKTKFWLKISMNVNVTVLGSL